MIAQAEAALGELALVRDAVGKVIFGQEDVDVRERRERHEQLGVELVPVGDDHDATRGSDDRALHGRLVGVGGAEAEPCRDAVRPDEGDVGPQASDRLDRLGSDGCGGESADPSADGGQSDPLRTGQDVGDGHGVGDDFEVARGVGPGREKLGDGARRGAGIQVQSTVELLAEQVHGSAGDGLLGAATLRRALRDGGLGSAGPGAVDRSAVDASDHPGPLEGCQITADRLGRDPEAIGEVDHGDTTVSRDQLLDLLLALRCVHVVLLEQFHTLQQKPTRNKNAITNDAPGPGPGASSRDAEGQASLMARTSR